MQFLQKVTAHAKCFKLSFSIFHLSFHYLSQLKSLLVINFDKFKYG